MQVRHGLIIAVVVCGCECEEAGHRTQPSPPETHEAPVEAPFFSSPPPGAVTGPTEVQASRFASESNGFGLALYGRARAEANGNFVISPASITLAFDMVYGGARGDTAIEMAQAMGIDETDDTVHEIAGRVLGRFNDPDREDYELRVVNRLFGEQSFTFEQDYLTLTRTQYRAPFEGVDFIGAPDTERGRINGWVAEQTNDRITDLLPAGAVNDATRLVVVNAIYFLGKWAEPFERHQTRDEPFTMADGSTVDVPLMRQTSGMLYGKTDGVSVVDLPYRGYQLVMTLVIPDEPSGLGAVEEGLSGDRFAAWVAALSSARVRIVMPRFEMHAKILLSQHVRALGLRQAFDPDAADFTGIAVPSRPNDRLYISEAFHQAFVKVDEIGTEAAAATAVDTAVSAGAPPPPSELIEVRADRPFLFAIRERISGAILFIGRVVDPR